MKPRCLLPKSRSGQIWAAALTSTSLLLSSIALAATFHTSQRMAGFSADSNYYIYLESFVNGGSGVPRADMQLLEINTDRCVPGGCIHTQYGEAQSNLSQRQAEDDLLQRTWRLRQQLRLTPPQTGTKLPVLSRSRTPDNTELVTVRLPNQRPLRLRLRQRYIPSTMNGGTATVDRAAMQIEVQYGNQTKTIGSLSNLRDWVLKYSIRDVYLSPDGQRVVVVLTMTQPTFEGVLESTLVQGFRL